MAYARKIEQPKCARCGKCASVRVYNRTNGMVGEYCAPHGAQALTELQRREDAEQSTRMRG